MPGMIGLARAEPRPLPPELPAGTPLRCNNCKRHLVAKTGSGFYLCSRLVGDDVTGVEGCGRMFVADVYEAAAA